MKQKKKLRKKKETRNGRRHGAGQNDIRTQPIFLLWPPSRNIATTKKKQNINMNSYREPLLRKHTIPQMNSIQNRQKENSNILIKQVVQFKSRRKKNSLNQFEFPLQFK